MKVLVTGGAGFIGSAVIRHLISQNRAQVVNLDCLSYAATLDAVSEVRHSSGYTFCKADIRDGDALAEIFARHRPDAVLHLAAQTHVDRSIDDPGSFVDHNVMGTMRLLEAARAHWQSLDKDGRRRFRFIHISTDEVFGTLGEADTAFTTTTPYRPNSPYAASKAAADHLVRSWHATYGLPVIVTNTSNNYGPYQFPEKLIPLTITRALAGEELAVYGDGSNIRDWLHVEDHTRALALVLERGQVGSTYLIGGACERRNIQVVETICDELDRVTGQKAGSRRRLIRFVTDRPGHDHRYAIDASATCRELDWAPQIGFEQGIRQTVGWYLANKPWWQSLQARYSGGRLGMTVAMAEN